VEHAEVVQLFMELNEQQQLEVIRQLLSDRVKESVCLDRCNLKALVRMLAVLDKYQTP
jgi:hypothetical protein